MMDDPPASSPGVPSPRPALSSSPLEDTRPSALRMAREDPPPPLPQRDPLHWLHSVATWAERWHLWRWLTWLVPFLVVGLGAAGEFGVLDGKIWMVVYVVLYALQQGAFRLYHGFTLRQYRNSIGETNGSLAGTVDTLNSLLEISPDERLGEQESRRICEHLLRRAFELVVLAYAGRDTRIRVTLAVPVPAAAASKSKAKARWEPRGVRVWCYDQPREPKVTLRPFFEWNTPGEATAFKDRQVHVVAGRKDVRFALTDDETDSGYHTLSVACLPVLGGRGDPAPALAVLSFVAQEPKFFNAEEVEQHLVPVVQPIVSLIALVLQRRRAGEPYDFTS